MKEKKTKENKHKIQEYAQNYYRIFSENRKEIRKKDARNRYKNLPEDKEEN